MKIVGILGEGGMSKFERKTRIFPEGLMQQKSGKFQGGHHKIDRKSKGSTSKKVTFSNFSGKAHSSKLNMRIRKILEMGILKVLQIV